KAYKDKQKALAGSHFVLNTYFAEIDRWSPDAIRARGRKLAQLALAIWHDVGRTSNLVENKKQSSPPPVKIRFRATEQSVINWKDAFIKLLKQFDASSPGLLLSIATERTLHAVISMIEDQFPRSRVKIGDVYIN